MHEKEPNQPAGQYNKYELIGAKVDKANQHLSTLAGQKHWGNEKLVRNN
jgi:hypothetical protein